MTTFKLHETKKDLFQIPQTYSLAHAVSADLNTSKGTLAWQFSLIFGRFNNLSKEQIHTGSIAVMKDNSRFIYFLVTKDYLFETSAYDVLQASLISMREHMRNHEITKVAMPRICCGNDGLKWEKVKEIINKVFAEEDVEILVCYHDALVMRSALKNEFHEVKGNIFSAPPDYSLAHSVSADLAMCAGIGLQFKCKFGRVNELVEQNNDTGNVAVLKDNERYIYYLITKQRNHEKCSYSTLFYSLVAMREHMQQYNVTKLAIPRIGCGTDCLNWLRVKNMLESVFANYHVEIIAYFCNPPRSLLASDSRIHHFSLTLNPHQVA